MKYKKSLISTLIGFGLVAANANYLVIIGDDHYEVGGFTKEIVYGEWTYKEDRNCEFDINNEDVYYNISFDQEETCDSIEERTVTTTKTYENGHKEVTETTEERATSYTKSPVSSLGTHLESTCKNIQIFDPSLSSGDYTINPNGNMNVYCDMDTSGGGWTLIQKEFVNDTSTNVDLALYVNAPVNDGAPSNTVYRMSRTNMNTIQALTTEMRVDCRGDDYLEGYSKDLFTGEGGPNSCDNNAEILYSSASLLGNKLTNTKLCTWFTSRREGCAGAWHIDEDAQTYGNCALQPYPWTGQSLSGKHSVDYFGLHINRIYEYTATDCHKPNAVRFIMLR